MSGSMLITTASRSPARSGFPASSWRSPAPTASPQRTRTAPPRLGRRLPRMVPTILRPVRSPHGRAVHRHRRPVDLPGGLRPDPDRSGHQCHRSPTGSATSTDLTEDGAKDDTLDFGFWKPTPQVDIEKIDAKGNDADTSAEAVDLGVSPGSTGLTFIVKNPGTEALTNVSVSDVVKANGSISGLSCTFPNNTVGLSWTGPVRAGCAVRVPRNPVRRRLWCGPAPGHCDRQRGRRTVQDPGRDGRRRLLGEDDRAREGLDR